MNHLNQFLNFRDKLPRIALVVFIFNAVAFLLMWLSASSWSPVIAIQSVDVYIPDALQDVLLLLDITFLTFVLVRLLVSAKRTFKQNRSKYIFDPEKWSNDWIFNGGVKVEGSDLVLRSSRAGCLLDRYYWKDFEISFKAKFSTESEHFGIVFRAEDLNNYFMIEVAGTQFKPRVRYSSGWEEIEEEDHGLKLNGFFKVLLIVKGVNAELFINRNLVFRWDILPSHVDVNHWEAGVNQKKEDNKKDIKDEVSEKNLFADHVQSVFFRERPGKIGFRANRDQGAIIRALKVKAL